MCAQFGAPLGRRLPVSERSHACTSDDTSCCTATRQTFGSAKNTRGVACSIDIRPHARDPCSTTTTLSDTRRKRSCRIVSKPNINSHQSRHTERRTRDTSASSHVDNASVSGAYSKAACMLAGKRVAVTSSPLPHQH